MRWRLATALVLSAATVNGCACEEPNPVLHVRPDGPVQVGQTVTFDSNEAPGDREDYTDSSTTFNWDLDGDGVFEVHAGNRSMQKRFDTPGTYNVTLDEVNVLFTGLIYGFEPAHGYITKQVVVNPPPDEGGGTPSTRPPNQPPGASFTVDHNPWYTENDINFDASASYDDDGTIVKYEWDWEADGTYDATGSTATHRYEFAGTYTVRLRVTDDDGATGTTERTVQVMDGVPPGRVIARAQRGVAAARAGLPFRLALGRVSATPGTVTVGGGRLITAGVRAHGRTRLTRAPRILTRRRSLRWAASLAFTQRGNRAQAELAGSGYILLELSKRASVCLAAKAKGGIASFDGRLAVAGGSGRGARLRGSGTFGPAAVKDGKAVVKGRLKFRKVHKRRLLPAACRLLRRN